MSNKIHSALESIARRDVSDNTNLWPQIAARIEQKDKVMHPKFKLAWTVLLTLLALALATTAAYAVYRYFSDPGMKSVGEAGMIQNVNATAQPTVLHLGITPGPMTASGTQQTLEGVTVTLDWAFAGGFDQAFHISARGLTPDMQFGMPTAIFGGAPQENQARGATFSTNREAAQTTGTLLIHQMMARETLDVTLDIPLLRGQTRIASFHFEMKNIPVYLGSGSSRSIFAHQRNDITLNLKWLNMTPERTIAHVCYVGNQDWAARKASISFGSTKDRTDASEVSAADFGPVSVENDERCIEIGFPLQNNPQIRWLVLTVDDVSVATGEPQRGPWRFEEDVPSIDWLSTQMQIPNLPTPIASASQATVIPGSTPVSQTEGAYTMALLSAYADANRVVFSLQLQGWKNYSLQKGFYYDYDLADQTGQPLDIPTVNNSIDPESHILTLQFSPITALRAERFTGKLNLSVQEDAFSNSPTQAFHFDFDLPVYKAALLTINQNVTANGLEMRIEKAEISPSYTKIDLCYAKPDAGDWYISNASLQAGSNQTDADNLSNAPIMLDTDHVPDPDNMADDFPYAAGDMIRKEHQTVGLPGTKHFICTQIGFPIGSQDQPETLTLTIPELWFSPENDISDADLKTAQDKLKPQGMEFTFDIESTHGNGFGGGGRIFNVHKKPAGMTDDDVFRAFYDALGHYRTGPWVFTVPLKP